MITVLIILGVVLLLVMAFSLMPTGRARVRRTVVRARPRRTVVTERRVVDEDMPLREPRTGP